MAYEQYCAACTNLNEKCDYTGRYYCRYKNEDHYACDPRCYSFCEAYSRSKTVRENMYENSRAHLSGGGCYITTIMCEILGYKDDDYNLNKLREFRNNVMQREIGYLPLLMVYDQLGPLISSKLASDKDGKELANRFYNDYISKAVKCIEEDNYKQAIIIYKAMTQVLADKYDIVIPFIEIKDEEQINPSELGHGRVLKPSVNIE